MKKILLATFLFLLMNNNAISCELCIEDNIYSEFITLNVWLIATTSMIISLALFKLISNYKIPKKFNIFFYFLIKLFKFIFLLTLGFICFVGLIISFWGMIDYFLDLIGLWYLILVISVLLILLGIKKWLQPKLSKNIKK